MTSALAAVPADVETRFGTFAVAPADVVHFAHGLPGFERCHRFVVVTAPELAPFTCLHGLDTTGPSFLTLDPRQVVSGYHVPLGAGELARLDARSDEPLLWLAIVHVDDLAITANLRAPLVINPRRMLGLQVMNADTAFATDHLLTGE
ncbi:MAG: flagellar assembly protein FliW [Acidobacteria bacterium]|nr:flagellar assembly protein FliW [Acidobacteriota bacterium]